MQALVLSLEDASDVAAIGRTTGRKDPRYSFVLMGLTDMVEGRGSSCFGAVGSEGAGVLHLRGAMHAECHQVTKAGMLKLRSDQLQEHLLPLDLIDSIFAPFEC